MPPRHRILQASLRPSRTTVLIFGTGIAGGSLYRVYFSSASEKKPEHLNPEYFTPFTLVSKDAVSSSSSIFTLRPQRQSEVTSGVLKESMSRGVWSIQVKQPRLMVARNYTPIPALQSRHDEKEEQDHGRAEPAEDAAGAKAELAEDGSLHLLIKREQGGTVSNYLHDLPERSTISIRGPFPELDIPQDVTDILFLAGGTGIAPALQVAGLGRDRKHLEMHILWCNRSREDCIGGVSDSAVAAGGEEKSWKTWLTLARKEIRPCKDQPPGHTISLLNSLKPSSSPESLKVDYFIDSESTFIQPSAVASLVKSMGAYSEDRPKARRKLILISGPDGFVEYWAGKKVWRDGREVQGPLRGQFGGMDLRGWKVVKL